MTGKANFIKNNVYSIEFKYIENATRIRQQASKTNNSEYIPPLFELAYALQELEENNTEINPQNSVMQWLRDRLDIQNTDNNVDSSQPTDAYQITNTVQSKASYNIPTNNANDKMQQMYNELTGLNLDGAKIELVKKTPMGI